MVNNEQAENYNRIMKKLNDEAECQISELKSHIFSSICERINSLFPPKKDRTSYYMFVDIVDGYIGSVKESVTDSVESEIFYIGSEFRDIFKHIGDYPSPQECILRNAGHMIYERIVESYTEESIEPLKYNSGESLSDLYTESIPSEFIWELFLSYLKRVKSQIKTLNDRLNEGAK